VPVRILGKTLADGSEGFVPGMEREWNPDRVQGNFVEGGEIRQLQPDSLRNGKLLETTYPGSDGREEFLRFLLLHDDGRV